MFKQTISYAVCGLALACSNAHQDLRQARSATLQSCAGGSVHGDAELARYRNCAEISGDFAIHGVTTLASLAELRSVRGGLLLAHASELRSLAGLERLESVSILALVDNRNLGDIRQLSHLHSVKNVALVRLPALRTLEGLAGLTNVDRLTLQETGLYDLRGTESLRRVRELKISSNSALINVGGLDGLVDVGELAVLDNPRVCAHFGFFAGLEHARQASFSGNLGLAHSEIARFEARQTQPRVASQ